MKANEHLTRLTIPPVMLRAKEAIATFPADSAYMGFSGGATLAEIGAMVWPKIVPVSLHVAAGDPWKRATAIASFGESVRSSGAAFESFEYPCDGHLFPFAGTMAYDRASAEVFLNRVLVFLAQLG